MALGKKLSLVTHTTLLGSSSSCDIWKYYLTFPHTCFSSLQSDCSYKLLNKFTLRVNIRHYFKQYEVLCT